MSNGECIEYQAAVTGQSDTDRRGDISYGAIFGINIAVAIGVNLFVVLLGFLIKKFLFQRIQGHSCKKTGKERDYENNITDSSDRHVGSCDESADYSADAISLNEIVPDTPGQSSNEETAHYERMGKYQGAASNYDTLKGSTYENLKTFFRK